MAYFDKLSFAQGYFHIGLGGMIVIDKPMPPDLRRRFWETWVKFRREIIEYEKKVCMRQTDLLFR